MLWSVGNIKAGQAGRVASEALWPLGIVAAFVPAFASAQSAPAAQTEQPDQVAEVVITGSFLQNVRQEDLASPVVTIDQQQIEKTGVLSLGDLTRYVPQNVGSVGGIQDLAKGGVDTRD